MLLRRGFEEMLSCYSSSCTLIPVSESRALSCRSSRSLLYFDGCGFLIIGITSASRRLTDQACDLYCEHEMATQVHPFSGLIMWLSAEDVARRSLRTCTLHKRPLAHISTRVLCKVHSKSTSKSAMQPFLKADLLFTTNGVQLWLFRR